MTTVLLWRVQIVSEMISYNGATLKQVFHRIWTTIEKSCPNGHLAHGCISMYVLTKSHWSSLNRWFKYYASSISALWTFLWILYYLKDSPFGGHVQNEPQVFFFRLHVNVTCHIKGSLNQDTHFRDVVVAKSGGRYLRKNTTFHIIDLILNPIPFFNSYLYLNDNIIVGRIRENEMCLMSYAFNTHYNQKQYTYIYRDNIYIA